MAWPKKLIYWYIFYAFLEHIVLHIIFNECHTDDDTLLLIPALYSTDINKL